MTDTKITAEQAKDSAIRLINSHFNQRPEARTRIPATPQDDDLLIMAYISQSEREIAELLGHAEKYRQAIAQGLLALQELARERDAAVERAEKAEALLLTVRYACAARVSEDTPWGSGYRSALSEISFRIETAPAVKHHEELRKENSALRIRAANADEALSRAEAAAAEMRRLIQSTICYECEGAGYPSTDAEGREVPCTVCGDGVEIGSGIVPLDRGDVESVLQRTAGTGWHSPEEWAKLTAERDDLAQWHGGHLPTCGGMDEIDHRCGCGYLQGGAYRELCTELHEANAKLAEVQALLKLDSHLDPVPRLRAVIASRDEERLRWEAMREHHQREIKEIEAALTEAWDGDEMHYRCTQGLNQLHAALRVEVADNSEAEEQKPDPHDREIFCERCRQVTLCRSIPSTYDGTYWRCLRCAQVVEP